MISHGTTFVANDPLPRHPLDRGHYEVFARGINGHMGLGGDTRQVVEGVVDLKCGYWRVATDRPSQLGE
jgi:hypothetical protein